jgi:hypothetical protein
LTPVAPSVGLNEVTVGLKIRLSPNPSNSCADILVAVIIPVVLILSSVPTPTPVRPLPSPEKLDALIEPLFPSIVTPEPTVITSVFPSQCNT